MVIGILIGVVIMAATIYLALNKSSTLHIRLACLGALALMIITLVICVIAYVTGGDAPVDWSTFIVSDEVAEPEKDSTGLTVIVFTIFFFLALFAVILALAMKEHKKNQPKKDGPIPGTIM